MEFDMPPAPGEFVAPEHAATRPAATAAMVPVSTGSPASPQPPSFQDLQAQAFEQMQAQMRAQQEQLAMLRAQQAEMMQRGGAMGDPPTEGGGETSLGLTILAVAAGAVLGSTFAGGVAGAAGGALLGAAAANGLRAAKSVTKGDEAADKAAMVDGTFAIGGAALGAYLLYRARSGKSLLPNAAAEPNEPEDEHDDEGAEEGSEEAKTDHTPLPRAPRGVKVTPLFAKKMHKKKRKKHVANATPIAALTTGKGDV